MGFKIKQNDTSPIIQATLKDANSAAVDLTGASVRFHMIKYRGTSTKVAAAAAIVDDDAGTVKYVWQSGDTDTVGSFKAEFQVTFSDGTVETFPNTDYIQIDVIDDIA
tara:strand:+ start:651 stop:974 length:324 start_codon:yes stop_codon:yes gene_type:complete